MKVYAILGYPVSHSLSPRLHNAVFHKMGLEDRKYEFLNVAPEKLEWALEELRKGKYSGFSVTIPYKQTVMKYLEEVSDMAKRVGAVNTILSREDGTLFGDNTDYVGFAKCLEEADVFFRPVSKDEYDPWRVQDGGALRELKGATALILGNGGVAQACISVLRDRGYHVTIASRRKGDNEKQIEGMHDVDKKVLIKKYDELDPEGDYSLIVNTTPVGMLPHIDQTPLENEHWFKKDRIFVDVIYNPKKTLFLKKAEQGGAKIVTGERMFLWQAVEQAKYFTGREEVPVGIMEQELASLAT